MLESDLKRYLVKSIRAQEGTGQRYEDKYAVGLPDLVLIPALGPVFFAEVKLIHGAKLVCTEIQAAQLARFERPAAYGRFYCFGVLLGYRNDRLFIGERDQPLTKCLSILRPPRLDSTDWDIALLLERYADLRHGKVAKSG